MNDLTDAFDKSVTFNDKSDWREHAVFGGKSGTLITGMKKDAPSWAKKEYLKYLKSTNYD